ncbi:Arylsulfatase [Anatilimnocola aggregata]|uniref:Arylsulfatase n=1 Tax=Anatilimnocola aggregata TaxID=2528021 RepID=A0A517Y9G6_9BACT|nr:sulfatase [Anatilimnocola aggregata]QDU26874.1 Arylsulfatase [Anatilimnocola aggregata]
MLRLLLFILLGIVGSTSLAAETPKPNIILFVTDDMSPDAGCFGNSVIKTPALDALARDGIRLPHAFCTTASCSASRSVILSGIHNHANAHYGHAHAYHHFSSYPKLQTLPVRLTAAGYRTARVGKYHVEPEAVYKFEQAIPGAERNPVLMANNCRDLIAAKSEKPFFLYFCTADPHRGGGSVPGDPLEPDAFGNRADGYEGVTEVKYDPKNVIVPPFLPDSPTCRAELAQYYQSISRVDQGLAKLVAILKEANQYDNTLIVFTSDHGIAMPGSKTTVYEPGLTVPMVYKLPGKPTPATAGRVCQAMVSHVDLTPTLLAAADALPTPLPAEGPVNKRAKAAAAQSNLQGRSYYGVLKEEQPAGWDTIEASHTFHEITMYYPMRVVRNRQHKLIWNLAAPLPYPFASDLWNAPTWQAVYKQGPDALYGKRTVKNYIHRPAFELYDLNTDPHEVNNLADDSKYAKLLEEMKAELKDFQQRTSDPWIMKWKYE